MRAARITLNPDPRQGANVRDGCFREGAGIRGEGWQMSGHIPTVFVYRERPPLL